LSDEIFKILNNINNLQIAFRPYKYLILLIKVDLP